MKEEIKNYAGKTIKSFTFEKEKLSFAFSDGPDLTIYAQGDCCSESWFEQISGEEALLEGAVIVDLVLVDLDRAIEGEYELEQFYGLKIKTSKGYADIDMRNLSNGYYGGYISINENDQYSSKTIDPDWSVK